MSVLAKPVVENAPAAEATKPAVPASARALGIDALRGLAIIGMVFSGVFPHEAPWSGWMFHAQVGPPDFTYTPQVPGITWVDLVFPFFLFAMGAAFPLAMGRKLEQGQFSEVLLNVFKRGALLLFFAIILRHLNWFGLQGPGWVNQLTSLLTFGCFFLVFMRFPQVSSGKATGLKLAGFGIIAALLWAHVTFTEFTFDHNRNDIIIMVLANMAVFGSLIYILTRHNLLLRMGTLAFFAAIRLTHDIEGSWTSAIWDFHPSVKWMYQFMFLKYLCIVLPGSVLGDLLVKFRSPAAGQGAGVSKGLLSLLCFALVVGNLYGLYTRQIGLTLALDAVLSGAGLWLLRKPVATQEQLFQKLFGWGVFFLFLGLTFEPYEGGIKKDPSSYSFWFLTSGLAFFAYILCELLSQRLSQNLFWKSIIQSGQNPMVAYVATAFLVSPLLALTHLAEGLEALREANVYLGVVKTFVITGAVVAVTAFTTRKGWFWRT
ncbi:DUF5009 domain-containing protein [Rufibacter glacialis]|uniref:DUF5009 domain-containing protein n=1 Tax=Rufibacter glacialis TaxID=1259555 RepID=A0A5M8QK03_9BACT|nr:DUF5009 domain-containing protein [Rufibacter glacialis]KAA6435324.1 DUF5009 domain-containing protein [Rufibacter glacialis]GGK62361.1 DUF5009 domain-containing protein [Rufibacter glacialis]